MMLPRIRKMNQDEPWLLRAILVGYPHPGIGLEVDIYDCIDGGYIVTPVINNDPKFRR